MSDISLENPFVAELLSTCLAQFMALSAYRSPRWTKARVAEYITATDDIPGRVSDTTIGRLLDPGYPQEPGAETLKAVAAFLLKMRAITQEQIALAGQSPSLIEAAAFPTIFPRPQTDAFRLFLGRLAGRFGAVEVRGSHLLASELVLKALPQSSFLIVQEVVSLFHVEDMDMIKRETRNLAPDMILNVRQKLPPAGGRELSAFALTGFVVVTTDIMALFLRGSPVGFHSVVNVRRISFAADESVAGLDIWRNAGWTAADAPEPHAGAAGAPRNIARSMAAEMKYHKFSIDKSARKTQDRRQTNKQSKGEGRDFFRAVDKKPSSCGENIDTSSDAAKQLISSIDHGDFEAFSDALGLGADPNITYPGSPDPIVFPLAADGRLEWVQALIATGRCDLTRVNDSGLRASHAPGVTARMFASSGPAEIVERFTALAGMLREEEFRQLRLIPPSPRMTP